MTFDIISIIEASGGVVTALSGAYALYRHVKNNADRNKELHKQAILEQAKAEVDKVKAELEEKIKDIQVELEAQKISVQTNMEHFKQVHESEIKNLGDKIELLRSDLSTQHQSLLQLLMKLVDSK